MDKIKYLLYCYLKSLNQNELELTMRFICDELIKIYEKDSSNFMGNFFENLLCDKNFQTKKTNKIEILSKPIFSLFDDSDVFENSSGNEAFNESFEICNFNIFLV